MIDRQKNGCLFTVLDFYYDLEVDAVVGHVETRI
jgi:hypothetical protein